MNDPKVGFPRPVKLGPHGRNFWWLPEIIEWEQQRAANSLNRRGE
jgi:predicted DNA-binding transcriptional regulator AlpA